MDSNDTTPQAFDIAAALGLLTRLPIAVDPARAAARGASAAWAWPLAGAAVGALAALTAAAALALGTPPAAAAALTLGFQITLTGALHEDGLADTADGFWGGWDKARRLAIMKDSNIGTYGVLALLIVTLLRWSALTALMTTGTPWAALIATGVLSRAPMAALMAALPNARGTGLSHSVGRPSKITAGNGIVVAGALATFAIGPAALGLMILAALVTLTVAVIARRKIGGQTGDVLGCAQQLTEAALLTALSA